MDRPQYSIRDLLWCVTLIGVGLGCGVTAWQLVWHSYANDLFINICAGLLAWIGVGALGAGIAAPFHRRMLGAMIAMAVAFFVVNLIGVLAGGLH